MAYKNYHVSAEDFVRAWESSTTPAEVAAKLGMPRPLVNARASYYRRIGVTLKTMKGANARKLDVEALNKLTQQRPNAEPPPAERNDSPSC